ncbi:hypothetical protein OEZ86_003738 [Tetradesmus obliquus]|nr:hypothetical protein OEZ86_003738 [Tetradesmus obliquus]
MGQSESKTQVHVHIDKPYYYAGDVVTGFVALHAGSVLDFKSINIKVTGVEKCQWQEQSGSGDNRHTETYRGSHTIFKNKLPIMAAGSLNPGDYQWPFSFQLPHNVPGSFNYASGSTKASIVYKVKADCDQAGMLKPDFKKTATIEVLQHTKAAGPPQPLALADEQPISFFCCFNKGVVGLKVDGSDDCFLPGESLALRAQVDNKSTTDVPAVEFFLHQKLTLTAKTMWGSRDKSFQSTRIHHRQVMQGFPNGAPGSVSHYEALLPLERSLEATCHGQVIHSTYELEVRAKTGCCLSEVAVRKPILLNDPQPVQARPAVMAPNDWAPLVYPTVQVALPTPAGYTYYAPQQQPAAAYDPPAYPHQPMQQYPQQQQGLPEPPPGAPVTYNITHVTNNYGGGGYPEASKGPASPVPTVNVYQEGYGASLGVGPQPARMEGTAWGSEAAGATAPPMPGMMGYQQPTY